MDARRGPPRLAESLLRRAGQGGALGLSLLGDLREEYETLRARHSRVVADVWFWFQTLRVVVQLETQRRRERRAGWSRDRSHRDRNRPINGQDRNRRDRNRRHRNRRHRSRRHRSRWDRSGSDRLQATPATGSWLIDVTRAVRGLRRNPAYAAFALAALALGIAANTTVFSLYNWVLLRPVPGVRDAERLATLRFGNDEGAVFFVPHSLWVELRARAESFAELAAYTSISVHFAVDDGAHRRVPAQLVTGTFFDVLGLRMAAGRGFTDAEGNDPDQSAVVVLSHRMAGALFGTATAPTTAVGSTVSLNGSPFVVVGVAAPGFLGPELPGHSDLWVPVAAFRQAQPQYRFDVLSDRRRPPIWPQMIGRLADGFTVEDVTAEMKVLAVQVAEEFGEGPGALFGRLDAVLTSGIGVSPRTRDRMQRTLGLMMGAVGFLLLLTCADVAHLAMARSTRRRREIAIRRALGATRGRLVREVLIESVVLSLAGGLVALGLTLGLVRLFRGSRLVGWLPELGEVALDARVFAFALALATVTGLAFGLVPALRSTRGDAMGATGALRHASSHQVGRLLDALVVAQLALSLPLLVGAGLMLRTVANLWSVDLGFDPRGVLSLSVEPAVQGYDSERTGALYREIIRRLGELPEVEAVGVAFPGPFSRSVIGNFGSRVAPWEEDPDESEIFAHRVVVTAGFHRVLGIPLLAGHGFDPDRLLADDAAPGHVILTESLARSLFPGGPAVGARLAVGRGDPEPAEVVGVIADARLSRLYEEPRTVMYTLMPQSAPPGAPGGETAILVRSRDDLERLAPRVRGVLAAIDPVLTAFDVGPLVERMDSTIASERLLARLGGSLALAAALLAAVGVFGVVSTTMRSRSRELGIRLALGADPRGILGLVLCRYAAVGGLGVVLGLIGSACLTRWLEGTLFGVTPLDPATFAAGAAAALLITLLASLAPARHAARIDPVQTLGTE